MTNLDSRVGFVVVNYNNSLITSNLITSLKKQNYKTTHRIVVVDNVSDIENVKILQQVEKIEENVDVIYSDVNLGYFKGLNCGIEYIKKNFPKINILIIGNNDLIFPNDFFLKISETIELFEKYPVISPNIITSDGVHQNPHVIRKISFIRELVYNLYYLNRFFAYLILQLSKVTKRFTDRSDEYEHETAQLIYQGHGSCYILGTIFFDNFNNLFAPTFLFGEEFFLSFQLKSKGYQVYYEPKIKVIHEGHSTIAKMPSDKMWQFGKIAHKEYRKYIKIKNLYKF